MQYDAIILELMSRIKALEQTCETLNTRVQSIESSFLPNEIEIDAADIDVPDEEIDSRQKMTQEMIGACYACAVRLHKNKQLDFQQEISALSRRTGMKKTSATMYVYAVKNMLSGTVYKRAINQTATETYFQNILKDFGPAGLTAAIRATRAHIAYRHQFGHTVDGLIQLCNRYDQPLHR